MRSSQFPNRRTMSLVFDWQGRLVFFSPGPIDVSGWGCSCWRSEWQSVFGVLTGTRRSTDRRTTSSARPDRETGFRSIVAAIRRVTEHGDDVIHAIAPPIEPLYQNALPASFGFPCVLLRRNPLNRYSASPACDSLSVKNMIVCHGQKR